MKLFYTAIGLAPSAWWLTTLPSEGVRFGLLAGVIALGLIIIAPVWWIQEVRRAPFGTRCTVADVPLVCWAWFAPIPVAMILAALIFYLPIATLPISAAVGIALLWCSILGTALVVSQTWYLPVDKDCESAAPVGPLLE
jgi:hypothetical protein